MGRPHDRPSADEMTHTPTHNKHLPQQHLVDGDRVVHTTGRMLWTFRGYALQSITRDPIAVLQNDEGAWAAVTVPQLWANYDLTEMTLLDIERRAS
jgi:hypothetical protein